MPQGQSTEASSTARPAHSDGIRRVKVPEITMLFWLIKILTTCA